MAQLHEVPCVAACRSLVGGAMAKGETPGIALKVCKPSDNTYWQICGSAELIPDDVLIQKLAECRRTSQRLTNEGRR